MSSTAKDYDALASETTLMLWVEAGMNVPMWARILEV